MTADMTEPRLVFCTVCKDSRWVCEDHPRQPWEHDGCNGAGVACACNPRAEVLWAKVYAAAPPADDEPRH